MCQSRRRGTDFAPSRTGALLYRPSAVLTGLTPTWVARDGTQEELAPAVVVGRFEAPAVSPDGRKVALEYWHLQVPTTEDPSGALVAVVSSGKLEIVRNADLRASLAAWETRLDEVRDNELISREYVFSTVVPYLASQGVPVAAAFEVYLGRWPIPTQRGEVLAGSWERTLRDPQFRNLLDTRYFWLAATTEEYAAALDAVNGILELVRSEIQ